MFKDGNNFRLFKDRFVYFNRAMISCSIFLIKFEKLSFKIRGLKDNILKISLRMINDAVPYF